MELGPAKGTDVTDRNTELGQRIGENWAVTPILVTRVTISIFMLRPPDAARTFERTLGASTYRILAVEWRSATHMENSVNESVETSRLARSGYVARRSKAREPNPMTSGVGRTDLTT